MLSCSSLTGTGSFDDNRRKPFVLFLGPFRGPFFHQGLKWFLFVLFFTVLAFTHVSCSLYLGLIGGAENNALPIDLCRPRHLHHLNLTTTAVFRLSPASAWTGFITSDLLLGYRWALVDSIIDLDR
jgi:hypothetical protein